MNPRPPIASTSAEAEPGTPLRSIAQGDVPAARVTGSKMDLTTASNIGYRRRRPANLGISTAIEQGDKVIFSQILAFTKFSLIRVLREISDTLQTGRSVNSPRSAGLNKENMSLSGKIRSAPSRRSANVLTAPETGGPERSGR